MKTKNIILMIIPVALLAMAGCNQNSGSNSGTNTPPDMATNSTGTQNLPPVNPVMPATNSISTNTPTNP